MSALPQPPGAAHAHAPGGMAALRAAFREGKAALLQHFQESRPTAKAASQLTRARK